MSLEKSSYSKPVLVSLSSLKSASACGTGDEFGGKDCKTGKAATNSCSDGPFVGKTYCSNNGSGADPGGCEGGSSG
jgi:hypothetical protein